MSNRIMLIVSLCMSLLGCATQCVTPPTIDGKLAYNKHVVNELKNGVNLYFESNSTRIDSKYLIYLDTLAKVLERNSSYIVEIEGHTDSRGSLVTNRRVSTNRANAVRNLLIVKYMVDPNQISANGVGSLKPIDSNATDEGRANNRRVSAILKIK